MLPSMAVMFEDEPVAGSVPDPPPTPVVVVGPVLVGVVVVGICPLEPPTSVVDGTLDGNSGSVVVGSVVVGSVVVGSVVVGSVVVGSVVVGSVVVGASVVV